MSYRGSPLGEPKEKGPWKFSATLEVLHAMKAWGMTPAAWREASYEDRVSMMAHDRMWDRMEAREAKENRPPKGAGGTGSPRPGRRPSAYRRARR